MEPILVTAATGKTGAAVVRQLLNHGARVRAVVHGRDARSERLAELGAEVVVADLFDVDGLRAAMQGTKRAYFTLPVHPHAMTAGAAFAIAARDARLDAVVGMTQWLASSDHPAAHTRQSWLTDQILDMIPGGAHIVVNPGYFADSYLFPQPLRMAAHLGLFPYPFGDSKNAPPSNEDIARVAVACLLNPDAHAGRTYRPTGPELIGGRDMAAALTRVFERPVRSIDLPWWMFKKAMRAAGVDPYFQTNVRRYVDDHKAGAFSFAAPTDHVERLSGCAAETFEEIAYRYGGHPSLRPSFGNRLAAFAEFMSLGFVAGYDLDDFERRFAAPGPEKPLQVMESDRWKSERIPTPTVHTLESAAA